MYLILWRSASTANKLDDFLNTPRTSASQGVSKGISKGSIAWILLIFSSPIHLSVHAQPPPPHQGATNTGGLKLNRLLPPHPPTFPDIADFEKLTVEPLPALAGKGDGTNCHPACLLMLHCALSQHVVNGNMQLPNDRLWYCLLCTLLVPKCASTIWTTLVQWAVARLYRLSCFIFT